MRSDPQRQFALEIELSSKLDQPRSSRAYNAPKVGIVDQPIDCRRPVKLRMVEHIESLDPEIERLRLRELQGLLDLHIEVADARTMEKPTGRITQLAKRFHRKEAGIKGSLAIPGIRIDIERS